MENKSGKCEWGKGIKFCPDGIHELDPCVYKDIEEHRNVTVVISKCRKCGNLTISWKRQENTEDTYFDDGDNEYPQCG